MKKLPMLFLVMVLILSACASSRHDGCYMSRGFGGVGGNHPAGMKR